jgi:hypothetical protein
MKSEPLTIRRKAMIDVVTKEPIRVGRIPEGWPYLRIPLDQLDQVKKLLEHAGFRYAVNKFAFSTDGDPYFVVVHFDHRVDIAAVQKLLDDYHDPEIVTSRS